jgi:hypothetical protein
MMKVGISIDALATLSWRDPILVVSPWLVQEMDGQVIVG